MVGSKEFRLAEGGQRSSERISWLKVTLLVQRRENEKNSGLTMDILREDKLILHLRLVSSRIESMLTWWHCEG